MEEQNNIENNYGLIQEYTLTEFVLNDDMMLRPDDLTQGATIMVSNEKDGTVERIISPDQLSQIFGPLGMQIPTEMAVERTLADPAFKQTLQEAEKKPDFDPKAEQVKIREFLAGVTSHNLTTEESVFQVPRQIMPASTAYRIIRCSNCTGLFNIISFPNHTCEYDADHNLIELQVENRTATIKPKKPISERVIMENQIRIRRVMKDELKCDLTNGMDTLRTKKLSKGPNECTICERKFVHPSGLVRHMEKHALDLIPAQLSSAPYSGPVAQGLRVVLKCKTCGRIFCDLKMALHHIDVHFSVQPLSLERIFGIESQKDIEQSLKELISTGNKLLTEMSMDEELTQQLYDNCNTYFTMLILSSVLQCEFCDFIFADISHLLVHSGSHLPERRFECSACDIDMTTSKEASIHFQTDCVFMRESIKQMQVSLNRYFVCNVCELKFSSTELLQEHRYNYNHYFPRLSMNRKQLILPCEFCDAMFEYAHEIQPHYEEKHLNKKKREKETRGLGITANGRQRQYLCDICGKSYTQSSHLWQHLRFHQGVKPFVCSENGCGRKFTIRPDLNDHIRKCHTGERPYHCLVCGKRFLTGSVFYQHRLIHRGERRYECEECGKRFYRADALKNHQRIHTGEKPYSCLFCTKTFRQRGDRDKHIRARHAHLDANSRLMMQMQKFQLESAAAAAALKAKEMQEHPGSGMSSSSMPFSQFPMMPSSHHGLFEYPSHMINMQNVVVPIQQYATDLSMQIHNRDPQMIIYEEPNLNMPNLNMDQPSIYQPMSSPPNNMEIPTDNTENVKVVVIDNTKSQSLHY